MRSEYRQLRVGPAGLGLEAYWSQFEGLEQRLIGYVGEVERRIAQPLRTVVNLGLVDTPERSLEAAQRCRREGVEILLVYATTYALSSTALPLIKRAKVPVVLLNLQPAAAIDYRQFNAMKDRTAMTGEWLAYCSACPVPEIANVLRRLEVPFFQVTGMLHDDPLTVYHGKVGSGLSVEMQLKHGPVTLLSVVEDRERGFMLLMAQGESVAGPILEIGNTNSRYRFSLGARGFAEAWNAYGPAHHCAIGVGHGAAQLHKVAALLGLRSVHIC